MLNPAFYALSSVIIVSLIPLLAGSVVFMSKKAAGFVFILISLSVGALFGDVFIHIAPKLFASDTGAQTPFFIIAGILLFFAFEKFLHWRHEHAHDHAAGCENRILPVGYASLASDGLHNFIDGIIIGASYLAGIPVGIATTIAVILHEIPQEIGDIGILLHAGFSKTKALLFNFYSGLLAIGGTIVALTLAGNAQEIVGPILALTAGSFIYIAGSDLLPELHKTKHSDHSLTQFIAILAGIALMAFLLLIE